jgi:molecular chaperone DnaK
VEIHVLREDGGETDAARAGGRAARGPKMKSIGRFLLAGIRSARQGEPRVEVSLELDADGILHAAARDLDTGAVEEVAFSQGLPFEEGTPAAEQTEELRLRVLSLARRARAQAGSVPGQEGLRAEIEDMVARSMAALSSGNRDELLGCRTALETLLGELRALAVAPGESPGPGAAARAAGNAEGVPRHG